jgi:phosphoenolpyruvate carboxylase
MYTLPKIERFNQNVLSKFQIYNSVFMTLPFDEIDNTGVLLPLFTEFCENGFKNNLSPKEIVTSFSEKYLDSNSEKDKINLLFRFIQYVERQIVLFDAIEDAAFADVNNLEGSGSLREIKERVALTNLNDELISFLENFSIRTVLTAHPTQFYPGSVLGIITDLTKAISQNNLTEIKQLLAQLGKTPFFKKEKPTPFDEAVSLIWYLENVFYPTSGEMVEYLQKNIYKEKTINNSIIDLGFWPGGDRDGNPFVTTEITLKVANRLRTSILKCYYNDIRKLKRKLTFSGIQSIVSDIENKIYRSVYYSDGTIYITLKELFDKLNQIKNLVIDNHQSLYLDEIIDLINKVKTFGFHFATLDIRQNSRIHDQVFKNIMDNLSQTDKNLSNYFSLSDEQKIKVLNSISGKITPSLFDDEISQKTIDSIYAIKKIQIDNGELGANRYIISNNESTLNVLETLAMIQLCDCKNPTVDVVPLF